MRVTLVRAIILFFLMLVVGPTSWATDPLSVEMCEDIFVDDELKGFASVLQQIYEQERPRLLALAPEGRLQMPVPIFQPFMNRTHQILNRWSMAWMAAVPGYAEIRKQILARIQSWPERNYPYDDVLWVAIETSRLQDWFQNSRSGNKHRDHVYDIELRQMRDAVKQGEFILVTRVKTSRRSAFLARLFQVRLMYILPMGKLDRLGMFIHDRGHYVRQINFDSEATNEQVPAEVAFFLSLLRRVDTRALIAPDRLHARAIIEMMDAMLMQRFFELDRTPTRHLLKEDLELYLSLPWTALQASEPIDSDPARVISDIRKRELGTMPALEQWLLTQGSTQSARETALTRLFVEAMTYLRSEMEA